MALFSVQGVSLNLGGKPLLDRVDLSIEAGERVCVTGRNGAGKSTLLSLLGGSLQPDSGIIVAPGTVIGMMPQNVPSAWQGSVFSLVAAALGEEGLALAAAQSAVSGSAARPGNPEEGDGWERYGEVMAVINRLQLDPQADFGSLSGGTRRRVALARALLRSEDLILDEPTNHLDLSTILWLENFLLRKARTLVFVSHDRAFAERLASRVVEIDRGRLHSYPGGFAKYPELREQRLAVEEREFALFDKKLAREEGWIRQGIKARRTRNMGRVRALREMRAERAARREKLGNVRMAAQEAERSGKLVLEAESVSFAYPGQTPLFQGFSTIIQRGDRIGIIGDNGSGKSTLIRLLLGELPPTTGSVRQGTRVEASYFDQLRHSLDPEASVMDSVAEGNDVVRVGNNTRHVAGYLQDFLFTPDRLRLPVKALSGGERNRLLLAKLFTRPSNLLVLDEPTNDLDVETSELLEELLGEYSGTVLIVSHDRRFLDNLVTGVLALEGDGKVHEYVGAYTDWLRQRDTPGPAKGRDGDGQAGNETGVGGGGGRQETEPDGGRAREARPRKRSDKEQREYERLGKELAGLPDSLDALEREQAELEARLAEPDVFARDPAAFAAAADRLARIEEEQTGLLSRWEAVERRLEELGTLRE